MEVANQTSSTDIREQARPADSTAARIGRFAVGSIFGITFMVLCFIMLSVALKGPDTIQPEKAGTDKIGLLGLPATDRLRVGDPAPDFLLNQLGGPPVQLSKLRGKTVLVNYWASWCEPCRTEMPEIQRFYLKYKNDNVVVLAVNIKESEDVAKTYFKSNSLTMPVLLDKTGEVPGAYRVTAFPESYFIDKNGKIGAFSIGILDYAQLEQKLQATWQAAGK